MNNKDIETYRKDTPKNQPSSKITRAARSLGRVATKKAFLLYYVLTSRKVAFKEKIKIIAALAYFIVPLDIVSDFIPFIGYGDDLIAIAWALHSAYSKVTPEIDQEAEDRLKKLFPSLYKD